MKTNNFENIDLESQIIQELWKDNTRGNTFHFITNKKEDTIQLDLVTHNTLNKQNFLLNSVSGESRNECLEKMLDYIERTHKEEHNWTVFWIDRNDCPQQSYFRGVDEESVRKKFSYADGARITDIKMSSIA